MKYGAMLVAAGLGLFLMAGCETLTQTPGENANMMARTVDTNGKEIPENAERLLLLDRPSWLAREPIPSN
jgi:hypothetical protein